MASLTRITCHAVHKMAPEEREALARELYGVHTQIFGGLDYEGFRHYVVDRHAWRNWVWVKYDAADRVVGYHATHAFRLDLQGRPSTVVRMEAGTLPESRGRDLTMISNCARLFLLWLQAPRRSWSIFAALTHPSSYTFLSHYAPVIWPQVGTPTPPEVQREMAEMADTFGLERVDEDNPMVRRVNWITLESEEERRRWQTSRRPNTRLYMRSNPGYVEGHGLVTLIPVNGTILLSALMRFVMGRAGRLTRMLFGTTPAPRWDETALPPEPVAPVAKPRPRPPIDTRPDFQPSRH
jgi:hypothetical protein